MRARVIAAILAAVLAIIGVVALVVYAGSSRQAAFKDAELVSVYQVETPIPANSGESVVGDSVKQVDIPKVAVPDGAVTDLSEIAGMKTTVALVPGEQLILSRFSKSGSSTDKGSAPVPNGLQEISIQLGPAQAAAALLSSGTKVGLIASGTSADGASSSKMFADDVLVTKVAGGADDGTGSVIVTLAVTEQQALQVSNAINFQTLQLTVQNDKTDAATGAVLGAQALLQ